MDLALFDFDGTLSVRETFGAFLREAVSPRRLAAGHLLLAPLVAGYRLRLVPGSLTRAGIMAYAFRGACATRLAACGQRFADQHLPSLLRPEAMRRLAWHRDRGDTVAVVSGALDVYLQPWCRAQGVASLCSALAQRGGRLTGRYRGPQCVGAEKARRVRAHYDLARFGRIFAYGDTHEDLALLQLAHEAYYRWRPWSAAAGAQA